MTPLMNAIYEHTLETLPASELDFDAYRMATEESLQLLNALQDRLSEDDRALLIQYIDAALTAQGLEVDAMFRAAWKAARELLR